MKISHIGLTAWLLALVSPAAFAGGLKDGSFEKPSVPSGTQMTVNVGGKVGPWKVIGVGDVKVIGADYTIDGLSLQPKNGLQLVNLAGDQHSQPGLEQTFKTVPGTAYMIWFSVGTIYNQEHGFGHNSTVVVKVNGDTKGSFTTIAHGARAKVTWGKFGVSFTATGKTSTVDLTNGDEANDGFCGLDGVSLQVDTAP
jgi:Cu/Ag efflux protein CusF